MQSSAWYINSCGASNQGVEAATIVFFANAGSGSGNTSLTLLQIAINLLRMRLVDMLCTELPYYIARRR